jgi:hypothetical protein
MEALSPQVRGKHKKAGFRGLMDTMNAHILPGAAKRV